jgi:hypothetical protein
MNLQEAEDKERELRQEIINIQMSKLINAKKTITREQYDQLIFYKSMNDQFSRMSDRLFYYAGKILDVDDDGIDWLTDYFDNDDLSITELLEHLDVDIEE